MEALPRGNTAVTLVMNGPGGFSNSLDGWEEPQNMFGSISLYIVYHMKPGDLTNASHYHGHDPLDGGWTSVNPQTNPNNRWAMFGLGRLIGAWQVSMSLPARTSFFGSIKD